MIRYARSVETLAPPDAGERNHLLAAILLVAGGRYPQVVVTNLDAAAGLARELFGEAARRGVKLSVPGVGTGDAHAVVVTRR